MTVRRTFSATCVLLSLWLLAGCGARNGTVLLGPETEDSYYREGQQFERSGRHAEALNAYLSAIEHRGTVHSPESHLQIAIIYKEHIKDPFEAVHYFKKYIDLAPPSPQVNLVREQMDAAKRAALQTLPGRLFEEPSVQLNAGEEIARLQRENNELRAEIQAIRGNVAPLPSSRFAQPLPGNLPSPTPFPAVGGNTGALTTSGAPSPFTAGAAGAARTPGITIPGVSQNSPAQHSAQPALPAGSRRYKIQAGDNLSIIARKHYGNSSAASLNTIARANSSVMTNINVLPRVGTEIVIPPAP